MDNNREKRDIFARIAPVYALFYNMQKKRYARTFDRIRSQMNFTGYKSVLDIGCGTGALCAVFDQNGLTTTGVDAARNMLDIARRRNPSTRFVQGDALCGLPFEDDQFDICTASYVAHGLKKTGRMRLYAEMNRIARHRIVIIDYNTHTSLTVSLIEWLERGDYFNFIQSPAADMAPCFADVRTIDVGKRCSWYICTPKGK